MTKDDLTFFKNWFIQFVKSYYSANTEDQRNIYLKEEHTFKVCENILEIIRGLKCSNEEMMLAEIIALFHDIGRFPQYAKYKTFRDHLSVNHGFLGAETLLQKRILKDLPVDEQESIVKAVRFH